MDKQQINKDHSNAVVWGINSVDNDKCSVLLQYPGVLENIYTISEDGKVYSIINGKYLKCGIRNSLPYVNLCCKTSDGLVVEPFYIKDLVAYNFHKMHGESV